MQATNKPARQQKVRFVLREAPPIFGEKPLLDDPEKLYHFFRDTVTADETFEFNKEHLVVAVLDSRYRLIGYNIVSVGTVSETSAHPREILRPVIALGGFTFALFHNHPSGDPSPSRADEMVTRRMIDCAQIMQISMVDHVIVGRPSPGRAPYFSFKEAGVVP
jgi:DNA repair protein RadC